MRPLFPCLALLLSVSMIFGQDVDPPEIDSISISPTSVDVASGDQVLTVTLEITDDDSGFAFGNLFLYNASGTFIDSVFFNGDDLTVGDSLDGTYVVSVIVPQYGVAGTWELRASIDDSEGNSQDFGGLNTAFPVPADAEITVTNTGSVDSAAPVLSSVVITPGTIDTGSLSQSIDIELTITDNLSGLDFASISFFDPSGSQQSSLFGFVSDSDRTSGDALSGTYLTSVMIPQGSADGTWSIRVFARDRVGNTLSVSPSSGGTFEVDNSSGALLGGVADAVDMTQFPWSTSGDEDWFIQSDTTWDGIDAAQSGAIGDGGSSVMEVEVTGPGTLDFMWKVDSESGGDFLSVEIDGSAPSDSISGDVDWVSESVSVPSGPQTVRFVYEKNGSGSTGEDAGWVDRVCFSADSDAAAPVIQYVSISPSPVNVFSGEVEVTVTLEVSDDFNGFDYGYVYFYDAFEQDVYSEYFDSGYLVSGDSKFGTYEVQFYLYPEDFEDFDEEYYGYEPGTWQIEVELYEQDSGDSRYYGGIYGGEPFPIPGTEFVTVNAGDGGLGPRLTSINSITPSTVDVTSGSQVVTVEFDIEDDNVGFGYGNVTLYNPDFNFLGSVFFDSADRISGDSGSGTYSVDLVVPQYGKPGTWSLSFFVSDFDNNSRDYPFEDDLPNPGDEEFTVVNSGMVDIQLPVLNSFAMMPSYVDTSGGAQMIDFDISVSDDLSGIGSVVLYLYDPNDAFYSDSYNSFDGGGALNGSFQGTFDLPQGSLEGEWRCVLSVRDRAGNSFFYARNGLEFGDQFPNPFSAVLTVGPVGPSTFGTFVSDNSLTGDDALPGSDPEGDLIPNVLELILGLDPNVVNGPDPMVYKEELVAGELRIVFTIDPSLTVQTNGNYLEISDGSATPLRVTGEAGQGLGSDLKEQLPTNTGGTTYKVTAPVTGEERGFVRLKFLPSQ